MRGIDLILEQGLNVKVLTFPNNEDPDSFARKVSAEELKTYLHTKAQDFIRFKIAILKDEAQNDPIKKADLVRDIIKSISVIPDKIQREIYVQETSQLLDISESVLYSALAQQVAQNKKQDGEQRIEEPVKLEVVQTSQKPQEDIDELEKYEREIIRTLLLYGNEKTDFVDWVEATNALGKKELKKEVYENVVAQEIYLNLQEDEIELSQALFKELYGIIIKQYNLTQVIDIKKLTKHQNQEVAQLATDIELEDDKYILSNWESRDIVVKPKADYVSKQVTDIILNLRRVLIDKKIKTIMRESKEQQPEKEQFEEIANYTKLRKLIFDKLRRVM